MQLNLYHNETFLLIRSSRLMCCYLWLVYVVQLSVLSKFSGVLFLFSVCCSVIFLIYFKHLSICYWNADQSLDTNTIFPQICSGFRLERNIGLFSITKTSVFRQVSCLMKVCSFRRVSTGFDSSNESPFACSVGYAAQYVNTAPALSFVALDAQGRNNNNVRPLKLFTVFYTSQFTELQQPHFFFHLSIYNIHRLDLRMDQSSH